MERFSVEQTDKFIYISIDDNTITVQKTPTPEKPNRLDKYITRDYPITYENFRSAILDINERESKINAIKLCRTLLGCGLKEAKDVTVSMIEAQKAELLDAPVYGGF